MGKPLPDLRVVRNWRPGDTREISERLLKKARLDGRFDSYSQVYDLEGHRWKVREHVSRPDGETIHTLLCVAGE